MSKKSKQPLLQNPGVVGVLASLLSIVIGLVLGFILLVVLNPGASRLYMNAWAHWPRAAYKNVRLRPVDRNDYTQYSTFIRVCTVFPFAFFPGSSTEAKNPRKIHCERREDML